MVRHHWLLQRIRLPPATRLERISWLLLIEGAVALMFGSPVGAVGVILGATVIAVMNPWHYIVLVAATLPSTIGGWTGWLYVGANGAIVDVRAFLTIGLAVIAGAVTLRSYAKRPERGPRLHPIEWLGFAYLGYLIVDGVIKSGGSPIWVPPAARWALSLGAFALARRYAPTPRAGANLMALAMLGFLIPSAIALVQFAVGSANLQNGALRATGLGGTSPIAVAFAGQMALLLGFFLALPDGGGSSRRNWAGILVGALAIIASATRLVMGTALLGTAIPLAFARRWRPLLAVAVTAVVILLARPDFAFRFGQALDQTLSNGSAVQPDPDEVPRCTDPTPGPDASLRFRFFIWNRLLEAWRDDPLLGIGPGRTPEIVTCAVGVVPHNSYIGALAETGLVGFTSFVGLQILVGASLLERLRRSRGPTKWWTTVPLAALVIFVCFNVLGALDNPGHFFNIQFTIWALVGVSLAAPTIVNSPPRSPD